MKKTKLEKGITLVALIITIVVLLILAVVSIGAVRDSGIIGHATNTTSESTVSEENEIVTLAENEWQLQKNTPNNKENFKTSIETALKNETKNGKIESITGKDTGPLTITFSKTGNKYTITADGEISKVEKDLFNEPDDDEKLTYANFWKTAYALYNKNKEKNCYISHNIVIYWSNDDNGNEAAGTLYFVKDLGRTYVEGWSESMIENNSRLYYVVSY